MITFNTQPSEYGDEWYPFFIGSFRDKIREYDQKEFHNINILILWYININPWYALANLAKLEVFDPSAVVALRDSSEYECPLTHKTFHALMPVAIFSDNLDKYFPEEHKPWYYEMAVDQSWNCKSDNSHLNVEIDSPVHHCILGAGYTSYTLPNDGSPDTLPVVIDLSNGDKMLAVAKAWYNK